MKNALSGSVKSVMGREEMKVKKPIKKASLLVQTAETLLVVLVAFAICYFNVFSKFEKLLTDRVYQSPRGINNKIKIISIDNRTLRELGTMGTWSRQVYADVINSLGDYADVIVMDLMITGSIDESGDKALNEACVNHKNVIAGSYINYNSVLRKGNDGNMFVDHDNIETVDQPIMAENCETGFVNAQPDSDGVMRSSLLTSMYQGRKIDSISYKAYKMYCEKNDITPYEPTLENGRMNISYASKPGNYENISLSSVLSGEVDPRVFSGCVVILGAYATGLYDQYAVPNSSELMFGCEIHANIIQSLIDKRSPVSANRWLTSLACAAVAGIAFLIFRRIKPGWTIALTVVVITGFVVMAILVNNAGYILPFVYFPTAMIAICVLCIVHSYISASAERKKISDTFKKYVAPQVVEEITKSGGYNITLGGESREVAVLFVDIRGFTPMSENLQPEQVVDILNSYLELTTNSIFNNGGTLDKFIGDATMAVFNAPFDLDDYVFRAVKTALDIVAGGDAIESKFLEKYGRSVGFGVGVNCGRAVVGNIGCSFRMDYTAIGDTVNTAARLEANAKRGQVLISQDVYEQVKDRVNVEPIGTIPLKGKSKEVFVYSLTGLKEDTAENEKTEE